MRFGTETSVGNGYSEKVRITKDGNVAIGTRARIDHTGRGYFRGVTVTGGADLAEQFQVNRPQNGSRGAVTAVEPGMVVVIDPQNPGQLLVSSQAYDRKVAGIISGAGGIEPGMVMGPSDAPAEGDQPVALTGRVYVWADASQGAIEPGDLLTTSDIPGHAMKVTDYVRAQGAIIGKAMSGLRTGNGLVLVLVTLQ